MKEKERLLKVLKGENVDRPPIICPGGMMNGAITNLLEDINKNHNSDLKTMILIAKRVHDLAGFENYGVPFCMTVESEPFGVKVHLGNKNTEPRVLQYNENDLEDIIENYHINPLKDGRMPVVLKAISELKNDNIPVIGNITGPMSTATSIVDPIKFIKLLKKNPQLAYKFVNYINDYSIEYIEEMIKAGADVIVLADPTATGEILGKKNFDEFIFPMYKKIIERVHQLNIPIIIHICGDVNPIIESLNKLNVDGLSFDSKVNMRFVRNNLSTNIMGNVSTQLLHQGSKEKIIDITKNCINSGVNIVSPACGLSMDTPVENLKFITDFVKGYSNG